MNSNINRRKKSKSTIFDLIAVTAIIRVLVVILVPSFKKYSIDSKEVEVESIIREFILAVKTTEISDKIEFASTDSIKSIEAGNGEKISSIDKYIKDLEGLNKIKKLTIEEANQIINNELDFKVNKEREFLKVVR